MRTGVDQKVKEEREKKTNIFTVFSAGYKEEADWMGLGLGDFNTFSGLFRAGAVLHIMVPREIGTIGHIARDKYLRDSIWELLMKL